MLPGEITLARKIILSVEIISGEIILSKKIKVSAEIILAGKIILIWKAEVIARKTLHNTNLSTKIPTLFDFELNPGLHCDMQMNNCKRDFVTVN